MGKNGNTSERIKTEVLKALSHEEAEDGLYFQNFYVLWEEDERPAVTASEDELMNALNDLVREGKVTLKEDHDKIIFNLAR